MPPLKTQNSTRSDDVKPSSNPGLDVMSQAVFRLESVSKLWDGQNGFLLSIPHLTICRGEKVAVVGYSGCGKSTLLDMLAMILCPDAGEHFLFCPGEEDTLDVMEAWKRRNMDILANVRMRHMGYVLQTGGLFPFLRVRDNISMNCQGLGLPSREAVDDISRRLGIYRHLRKYPKQLSVGERQRVAIARAMAHNPSVVIADEPTASLDPVNAKEIMELFTSLTDSNGVTLIVATHDLSLVHKHDFRSIVFSIEQDEKKGVVSAIVSSEDG